MTNPTSTTTKTTPPAASVDGTHKLDISDESEWKFVSARLNQAIWWGRLDSVEELLSPATILSGGSIPSSERARLWLAFDAPLPSVKIGFRVP
jgi:hypothetical protein